MKFPNTSTYPSGSISLADAYIHLMAEEDRELTRKPSRLPPGSLGRASLYIGRACKVADIDWGSARKTLQGAHDELHAHKPGNEDPLQGHERKELALTALMLANKERLRLFNGVRRQAYNTSINGLQSGLTAMHSGSKGGNEQVVGKLGEIRTRLMLNRYNHPWAMAVSSLKHHDNGFRGNKNYDIAYVESGPHTDEPLLHKIQVKARCFGFCIEHESGVRQRQRTFRYMRQAYDSDIILISACCDLRPSEDPFYKTNRMLLHENRNTAPPEDVAMLDTITNQLSLIASGADPERFGTYKG